VQKSYFPTFQVQIKFSLKQPLNKTTMASKHAWKFFRAGGFDQVKLESAADLMALEELDQKLWVALACPTTGLEFDSRTLSLVDTDKDGRVRAPEIIAATKWAVSCLKDPGLLLKPSDTLSLSSINDATPEGKQLLASARQILTNLGKPDATSVSLDDTLDTAKIFAKTQFNGDGIVPPECSSDASVQAVITDIMACMGPEVDRSAKPGINQAKVDVFFTDAQAYSDWWKKAESDPAVLPLEVATVSAAATLKAVKPKVDDYFARCRLAAFDARALSALNREEKEYLAWAAKDLTITSAEIANLPLSQIAAGRPLPLTEGLNPAWADAIAKLNNEVINPIAKYGSTLTEAAWNGLSAKFAPYEAWAATKAGATVEKLGLKRVREILAGNSREVIAGLIAKDKALEPEATGIGQVERLVRYQRDLYKLLNNFVCFRDFYGRKDKAIFQAGTLYLDQRSCELCMTVEDAGRHSLMAALAGTYLAYCDCVRKATGEKLQIVAAFTGGDSDNLMVGRNGIFYDRKGRDWDATITKILDNPISIRQAFWSPYKKLVRMMEEQIAKRAAAADANVTSSMQATASGAVNPIAAKPPEPKKIDTGTLAAIGLVLTTLLGALGTIFARILGLAWWQIPFALAAIILAISLPSMVIAWLKLRKRNLGPILDANGWAVNALARINVPFGGSLTQVAALPPGASRDMVDPFAEAKRPWKTWLFLIFLAALIISWLIGRLDNYLPGSLKSTSVLGTNAPAYVPPPAITVTNTPGK
jgi:hypothetical protein